MMKKFMKKLWEKKDSKKGFTLVELIVVLVILAILMAIMIPAMTGWIGKAKAKQNDLTARTVYMGAQSVAADILQTKAKIPDASSADKITMDMIKEYTGTLDGVTLKTYALGDGDTTVTSVTITVGGKDVTYPATTPTT